MTEHQTELEHARSRWHEANTAIGAASGHGNPPDPHRYAALLDARAGWWDHLGQLADREGNGGDVRDVYAIACSYAGILDRQDAARVRFRYRIPTLHPSGVAQMVGLNDNRCQDCGRPWLLDPTGACPTCPALLYGITPGNAHEAANYPPGRPWAPEHTLGQEDVSTARHERGRDEALTETEWNALRELAWSPVFEPPAGIPERARHDALRLALGEAERLAGRARANHDTAVELANILHAHSVLNTVGGQPPKLYTDLLEWNALNVEREICRLHQQDVNQIPNKIPARVKAETAQANPDPSGDVEDCRRRTIPERLDYWADQLGDQLDSELGHGLIVALGAAVVGLGSIATELRTQDAKQEQRQRDHAETVKMLGRLVDHEDTPCRSDTHGFCLEHHMRQPCDVPEARALLARIRSVQQTPVCECPHEKMPDGTLVYDGVPAAGCPFHDVEQAGGEG